MGQTVHLDTPGKMRAALAQNPNGPLIRALSATKRNSHNPRPEFTERQIASFWWPTQGSDLAGRELSVRARRPA